MSLGQLFSTETSGTTQEFSACLQGTTQLTPALVLVQMGSQSQELRESNETLPMVVRIPVASHYVCLSGLPLAGSWSQQAKSKGAVGFEAKYVRTNTGILIGDS